MAIQQPATPTNDPLTPGWQRILAGFSLALVTVLVAAPVGLVSVLLWAIVLGVALAQTLEAAGVLGQGSFAPSVNLAAAVVGLAAVVSLGIRLPRLLRRRPARTLVDLPPRPGRWLLVHPWVSAGLAIVVGDVTLVPADRTGVVDVHAVLVGTLLIATGLWLVGSLTYGLIRGWALAIKLVWAGVCRSSFFAGIVVVVSLAATLAAGLLWNGITQRADTTADARRRSSIGACGFSAAECTRLALVEIAAPHQPAVSTAPASVPPRLAAPSAPAPAPPAAPEEPPSFERCIEELHRSGGPGYESARDIGLRSARRTLGNPADAEDVVHGVMVSVCLGAERIAEVRPYFLKSVVNAALRMKKVSSRTWCPLDPDEPPPGATQCIATSLSRQAVQEDMEMGAWLALCELDASDRRILEMRFWQGMSHARVAAALGISEEAARKRYSRALVELRTRFKRRCD